MEDDAPTIKKALAMQASCYRETLMAERDRLRREEQAIAGQIAGIELALRLIGKDDEATGEEQDGPGPSLTGP